MSNPFERDEVPTFRVDIQVKDGEEVWRWRRVNAASNVEVWNETRSQKDCFDAITRSIYPETRFSVEASMNTTRRMAAGAQQPGRS